jgi:prepilin-type N-terminal cleavage/methylation domain-containing protein
MGKINLLKKIAGYRGVKKRAGFTLIEVIVAMGIFFIVLIAFLSSYYSYYRNVQLERYKTIGENLAQLQLEDIQNLPVSILRIMVGENSSDGIGYYPFVPDPVNPDDKRYELDNYIDKEGGEDGKSIFDSGIIPATFRIYSLTTVGGLASENIPGIGVEGPSGGPYTLALYNETIFPKYDKKIVIQDLTTTESSDSKKIFKISVTVYWDNDEKHVTVEGLKNDVGYAQ